MQTPDVFHLALICVCLPAAWRFSSLCQWAKRKHLIWSLNRQVNIYFEPPKAFELSLVHRVQQDMRYDNRYIYGTLTIQGAVSLFSHFGCPTFETCIDFGCGDGMTLFVLSRLLRSDCAIGIEIIPPLAKQAQSNFARIQSTASQQIQCHLMDFHDFSPPQKSCFVFFNASGYFGEAWTDLLPLFEKCASGSWLCTMSHEIHSPFFEKIGSCQILCSWGWATAHCHVKTQ